MKKLLLAAAAVIGLNTAVNAQDVGIDRELDAGMEQFRTFAWSEKIDQIPTDAVFIGPNGVVVFNNQSTRSRIKAAVEYELSARGYQPASGSEPDFIVTFSVLEQAAEMMSYDGYELVSPGTDTVRTQDNIDRVRVEPGTVVVNFIDRESGRMVWRGYASGILNADMINDENRVREAVSSIFREYRFRAAER
jgi:hypothetical protein